ncbi:hypothetical protein SA21337_0780 [Staphylococcus aureus subsp. aureus 21337]|nr:hypothetical protein SA21337_0780 [Staphylococcus aureus subsp. aureus 21337]
MAEWLENDKVRKRLLWCLTVISISTFNDFIFNVYSNL